MKPPDTSSRTSYRSRRLFILKSHRSFIPSLLLSKSNPLRWASIRVEKRKYPDWSHLTARLALILLLLAPEPDSLRWIPGRERRGYELWPASFLSTLDSSSQASYRLRRVFMLRIKNSSRAHSAAPRFRTEPATLGFGSVLGTDLKVCASKVFALSSSLQASYRLRRVFYASH